MLSKLIKKTEIRSKEGVLHFRRWRVLETKYFRFYVHQIFESDKDAHLHNHPWNFLSFVLKGGYFEELSKGHFKLVRRFGFNWHKAADYHKITLYEKPTISLFFTFGEYRPWGYETLEEGHIDSEEYRQRKNAKTLPS
jgi:hypothetical protein